MFTLWFGASSALAAPTGCAETSPQEVDDTIVALFDTYRNVDEAAFDRTQKNLVAAVSCLSVVPTGPQIARLHQAMALAAYVNGQTKASRAAMTSARNLDPGWKLDPKFFPESHPFWDLYGSATDPGPVQGLGEIPPEVWVIDGFESDQAPVERAFLLQVKRDGEVVWSGYIYDRIEVPDRGQSVVRSAFDTPHTWWVGAGAVGRLLSSTQTTSSPGWSDAEGRALGGGGSVSVRFTPVSAFAVEVNGSLVGGVDPVLGGGQQPSGSLVLVGGAGSWVGDVQPHAGVRVGTSADRIRSWTEGADREPVLEISTVVSALVGLEAGLRAEGFRGALGGDFLLANLSQPYQLRLRGEGGALVTGPLALEGGVELRNGGLDYVDGARDAGRRKDTDVRVGVGIAIWQ